MTSTSGSLRWRTGEGEALGLEHVELKVSENGIAAEAVVVGGGETGFGARWRITLDPDWTSTRSLHLTRLGGPTVALRHDGYGEWSDGEGKKRKEFQGLLDCVVLGSPFGFVQVAKRFGAKAAKAQKFDVVTVSLPDLAVARLAAVLEPLEAGRRYRLTLGGTATEVEIDGDGLPLHHGEATVRVGEPTAPTDAASTD